MSLFYCSYLFLGNLTYEKHLRVLYAAAYEARVKWKFIGLALNVNPGTLDSIAAKNKDNPDNCFYDMLSEWLKPEQGCTLDMFISALESKSVACVFLCTPVRKAVEKMQAAEIKGLQFGVQAVDEGTSCCTWPTGQ